MLAFKRGVPSYSIASSLCSSYTRRWLQAQAGRSQSIGQKIQRFWKQASVQQNQEGFHILLDHRPLKTPKGSNLLIPPEKSFAAWMIANEWQVQPKFFNHGNFPFTSLFVRAQDDLADEQTRHDTIQQLVPFLQTDTICFHQPYPESLVQLQSQHWDPLLSWCQSHFQVKLHITHGLLDCNHPKATIETLRQKLLHLTPLELACFESAALATKSYIISLALLHHHISAQAAVDAARVETTSQLMKWGKIEEFHDVDLEIMSRQVSACSMALQ